MTIKNQFEVFKNNWLIVVLIFVVLIFVSNISLITNSSQNLLSHGSDSQRLNNQNYKSSMVGVYSGEDFAPEENSRKIITTTSLEIEIKRGSFYKLEKDLIDLFTSTNSLVLSKNVRKIGEGRSSKLSGNYYLKVDIKNYSLVLEELKRYGEIEYIDSNLKDITGNYKNLEIELASEKERLNRYLEMYSEVSEINDKINLNDRIFNQERRIKYLENSLNRKDEQIEYVTIYFTMTEKKSFYSNVVFVSISNLLKDFIDSFNLLISLFFRVLPWVIIYFISRIIYLKFNKSKKK